MLIGTYVINDLKDVYMSFQLCKPGSKQYFDYCLIL